MSVETHTLQVPAAVLLCFQTTGRNYTTTLKTSAHKERALQDLQLRILALTPHLFQSNFWTFVSLDITKGDSSYHFGY